MHKLLPEGISGSKKVNTTELKYDRTIEELQILGAFNMTNPSGTYSFYPKLDYIQPSFKNLVILIEAVDKNQKDAAKIQEKLVRDCFARKFQPVPTLNDLANIARQLKTAPAFDEFHKQLAVKAAQGRVLSLRDVYARFYDSGMYKDFYDQFIKLTTQGSEAIDKLIKVLKDTSAPKEWKAALLTNELAKHVPSQKQLDTILRETDGTFLVAVFNQALRNMKNTLGADIAQQFVKSPQMRDALAKAALNKVDGGYKQSAKILDYLYGEGGYQDLGPVINRGREMANRGNVFQETWELGRGFRRYLGDVFPNGNFFECVSKFFVKS